MKSTLLIIAVLLFAKAEAQKAYPKIKTDTNVAITHNGNSVLITRTKVTTTTDSEIVVPYFGHKVTTPTKVTTRTALLSQKTVTVSKEVIAEFGDTPGFIDNYLIEGEQPLQHDKTDLSLKHGPITRRYIFYLKDNVLLYKIEPVSSGESVMVFIVLCLAMFLIDYFFLTTTVKEGLRGHIINGVTATILTGGFVWQVIRPRLYLWDEALVPVVLPLVIFFLALALRKIRERAI